MFGLFNTSSSSSSTLTGLSIHFGVNSALDTTNSMSSRLAEMERVAVEANKVNKGTKKRNREIDITMKENKKRNKSMKNKNNNNKIRTKRNVGGRRGIMAPSKDTEEGNGSLLEEIDITRFKGKRLEKVRRERSEFEEIIQG